MCTYVSGKLGGGISNELWNILVLGCIKLLATNLFSLFLGMLGT